MANTYKNAFFNLTDTTLTTVYTCPANTTALVKTIQITNEHGSNNLVEIFITDASASATFEVFHASMAAGTTENGAIGTLILEAGDILKIQAATANVVEGTVGLIEIDF